MPRRRGYGDQVDKCGEIPPDLPALWAACGSFGRAESLVQFLSKHGKAWSPAGLARSFAAMGDLDRAERLVRASSSGGRPLLDAYETARAWTDLAWLATTGIESARARDLMRRAYAAARSVEAPYRQAHLLLAWSRVRAVGGDRPGADALVDRACARAMSEDDSSARQKWVFEALPLIVTGNGDLDRAESLISTVADPGLRAHAAAGLAVMLACIGERDRAETMIGTITDQHRRDRVSRAIASVHGAELRSHTIPRGQARALTGLARWAAGGIDHPGGPGDWPQTLVRHVDNPGHQRLIFAALAAMAIGKDRDRAKPRAVALADRAADIVAPVPVSVRPQALVDLAWIVVGAMEWTRVKELAITALELTRDAEQHAETLWEARLLRNDPLADEETTGGLPTLIGSPKQRKWAQSLRTTFTERRWGTRMPAVAAAGIARLTEAQWWIENRTRLDTEFDNAAGIQDSGSGLPEIQGTPKQKATADELRDGIIRERWPEGPPFPVAVALAELDDAEWWVDHRDHLAAELADFAAATRWSGLPDLVGLPGQRKRAASLRADLVHNYWSREIPLAVRVALNRLTDAGWWIGNARGDGHPRSLARAFGKLLPRLDHNMMALPHYGPWPEPGYSDEHEGPCRDRPAYDESYEAVFAVTAEHGDIRSPSAQGRLTDHYARSCCGKAGWQAGAKDGEEVYVARQAEALRRERGLSEQAARDQARANLAQYQQALNGHG